MERIIMIVAAMEDVELNIIKEKLEDIIIEENGSQKYYIGKIFNKNVVLCSLGMGMINSTMGTMYGIEKYKPSAVIMQGIAGGHANEIHKNDIIISEDIININSILTESKNKKEGSNALKWKLVDFETDKEPIIKTDVKLLEHAQKVNYSNGKKYIGRIGSGDVWNRESDRIISLNQKYSTLCEEMEGYAAAYVCKKYNVPFIDIRVISNNEILKEEYDRSVGKYSQEFTLKLLKEY